MAFVLPLIDTHCHLNHPAFAGRLPEVLARAEAAGVGTMIVPGWDAASSRMAIALAAVYPQLQAAVGLHPWWAQETLEWLPALLDDPHVVAVGEIGFDPEIEGADLPRQEAIFRQQLAWARERDLPVLLHCRRGWGHLLDAVRATPGVRGVLHAFSSSAEIMRACLDLGLHLGLGGLVTRPNARRARDAAATAPLDRLLLETDAPSMALEGTPAAGVEPCLLPDVLGAVAALRGADPGVVAEATSATAGALFRL